MAVHYLLRAKIEAKARAKPKEGLGTCFSLFRPFLAKRISVEMALKNGNNYVHFHGTPRLQVQHVLRLNWIN
jgi:hypothetical protein